MSNQQHQQTHAGHEHGPDDAARHDRGQHDHHDMGGLNSMAASATLHCLTGCAIGEILGLMIGTAMGLSTGWTTGLAIALAFLFGYTLSTFPLVKHGLGVGAALSIVVAADTLSIATMEIVDNLVMAVIPGAMDAGLVNSVFWIAMMIALTAAFAAAYPVNRYLLQRGKGHALTHSYHPGEPAEVMGARRFIPDLSTATLTGAIIAFMLGGLTVSVAAQLENKDAETGSQAKATAVSITPGHRPQR